MTVTDEDVETTAGRLRRVMGRVPTGVMVLTAATPAGQDGRTVNSFTSVSLEPALVSVCLATTSAFLGTIRRAELWAVSVLAADQEHLSRHFATPGRQQRFDGVPHTIGALSGAALLDGAVAALECRTVYARVAGDHEVLIAEVLALRLLRDTASLVFYRGGYASTS